MKFDCFRLKLEDFSLKLDYFSLKLDYFSLKLDCFSLKFESFCWKFNNFALQVKELRNRADEAARNKLMHEQEGVQFTVPLIGQHFENLLASLANLYNNDQYGLILDFWCPAGSENTERLPQR